ncbi:NUDIX domain-containing protein [Bacillus timonensis]|uniref:NUDIX domain-containing protein n=1 Tax=Bacillus timonensis TaxID=1033734 RepID=A0A4S3PRM3_9BACI|nr:NUDIX domain-containing protein [Bacillus timonensis]MCC3355642.1 NUDIX domain-containing protein [Bacillus sp. REN16]THE12024.1 NUDIX domain-containing protein [Bacillus timonensis]
MRNRGSDVIIENGKVGLIQRIRHGSAYYVFPGGGVENGETPEDAAKREAFDYYTTKDSQPIHSFNFLGYRK